MVSLYRGKLTIIILTFLTMIPCIAQDWYQSYIKSEKSLLQPQWNTAETFQFQSPDQFQNNQKSVFGAFIMSLAVPGLGEAYIGETQYTRFFIATEVLGWGLYIANILQVESREEQYKNFASQHAGINQTSKDVQFWIDIGKFDSIYDHNEERRRQRDVDAIYAESVQNFWAWDKDANRQFYEWQRIRAREIERREVFFIGGIVLNHVVSAINALRLARAHNRQQKELSWKMDFDYHPSSGEIYFSIIKTF
jgi:hypothetical protein